jgi:hypothetical protein
MEANSSSSSFVRFVREHLPQFNVFGSLSSSSRCEASHRHTAGTQEHLLQQRRQQQQLSENNLEYSGYRELSENGQMADAAPLQPAPGVVHHEHTIDGCGEPSHSRDDERSESPHSSSILLSLFRRQRQHQQSPPVVSLAVFTEETSKPTGVEMLQLLGGVGEDVDEADLGLVHAKQTLTEPLL